MQSAEPVARVGRDRRLGLHHRKQSGTYAARRSVKYLGDLEKNDWRFGENCSVKMLEIWRNMVGDLEKLVQRKRWRFGETWSAIWRNLFGEICWRFGETWSAIWRKLFGEKHWRFGETWQSSYGDLILEFVKE